jgi:inhibitor of KinA sporulation pathway (predicted exonuclease)
MISTLQKIIVIDLEATCYEGEFPEEERSEIIQIGACLLDMRSGILPPIKNKTSYLVRPYFSKISKYCEELTGITSEKAKRGMRFDHARNKLAKEFGTKSKIWAAWGEGDRLKFIKECEVWGVEYPFSEEFINVSSLFSLAKGFSRRINLEEALKYMGFEFIGEPHRADNDAYNTAQILYALLISNNE